MNVVPEKQSKWAHDGPREPKSEPCYPECGPQEKQRANRVVSNQKRTKANCVILNVVSRGLPENQRANRATLHVVPKRTKEVGFRDLRKVSSLLVGTRAVVLHSLVLHVRRQPKPSFSRLFNL